QDVTVCSKRLRDQPDGEGQGSELPEIPRNALGAPGRAKAAENQQNSQAELEKVGQKRSRRRGAKRRQHNSMDQQHPKRGYDDFLRTRQQKHSPEALSSACLYAVRLLRSQPDSSHCCPAWAGSRADSLY